MRVRKNVIKAVFAGVAFTASALAQQAVPADNTKANKRDREAGAVTADQQKMNKPDQETARTIRQAINEDKSLSTYAHNVKVIVQDGTVALKGPVRSEEEKDSVFKKAASVAGDSKVVNQLEIAPSK
jgi:hyperosmotically inducible protein